MGRGGGGAGGGARGATQIIGGGGGGVVGSEFHGRRCRLGYNQMPGETDKIQ